MSSQGPITVNPAHWLDGDNIPAEPPRLRTQALRVAQAIEAGGPLARGQSRETLIPCTKHPDGVACPGLMVALKQRDDAILLFCPICTNDEYLIYEWEDTLWANGPMEPIDVAALAAEHGLPFGPERVPGPDDRDDLLQRVLTLVGSRWTSAEVRRTMATAAMPSHVVQAIVGSLPTAPPIASIERLVGVLMDLWNDTRATPPTAAAPQRRTKVGVNQPCPCGSGKKYKRCCMHNETTH